MPSEYRELFDMLNKQFGDDLRNRFLFWSSHPKIGESGQEVMDMVIKNIKLEGLNNIHLIWSVHKHIKPISLYHHYLREQLVQDGPDQCFLCCFANFWPYSLNA